MQRGLKKIVIIKRRKKRQPRHNQHTAGRRPGPNKRPGRVGRG